VILLALPNIFSSAPLKALFIILCAVLSGLFGVIFSIRVGGADMPITISLLNSLSASPDQLQVWRSLTRFSSRSGDCRRLRTPLDANHVSRDEPSPRRYSAREDFNTHDKKRSENRFF